MLPATADPLPSLHGLYHRVPWQRLAFILEQAGRQSDRVRRRPASSRRRTGWPWPTASSAA